MQRVLPYWIEPQHSHCCTGKGGSKKQFLPVGRDLPSECCLTSSTHKEIKHYVRSAAEIKVSSEQPMEANPITTCLLQLRCTCSLSSKSWCHLWRSQRCLENEHRPHHQLQWEILVLHWPSPAPLIGVSRRSQFIFHICVLLLSVLN